MIISHSRRFIFVKCRKTASTSLEREIVPQLSPQDVWTPISSPSRDGQNHYSAWPIDWLSARSKRFSDYIGRNSRLHWRFYHDHIAAARIATLLPGEQYRDYYKFCFDRNPWDFVVSLFHQRTAKGKFKGDFDRFLYEYPVEPNWLLYTIDDEIVVDHVYRYEDMDSAAADISARLDVQLHMLQRDKEQYRADKDYRPFYSQSSRDHVAHRWDRTIALLQYDF
jgi:hypothetical protein